LSYAGQTSVVQILPPLLLADSRLAHESTRGVNRHAAWLTEQLHACFRRGPICLAPVAVATRGNQVLPLALSASSARNYMLQFQVGAQELLAAILANVSIANEDVLPRKRLDPQRQTPILAKANDTRQLQPDVHIPIARLFGDGNTLDEQHEGTACARNVHGLIACIEY